MKLKKSQGHVEMIISLVLFVGAILFILAFINPVTRNQEKVHYINNIEKIFLNETSAKFEKLSIVSTSTDDGRGRGEDLVGCYKFNDAGLGNYIEVLDASSAKPPYKYTLYFSEIFDSTIKPNNKDNCEKKDFILSSFSEEDMIVYEKIQNLKIALDTDYSTKKRNLGITKDFSFSLLDENKGKIADLSFERKNTDWIERESEYIPLIIINKQGQIQKYILNLRVW